MKLKRLYHSLRLCLIPSAAARANYIRTHHLFAAMGENCTIMKRKLPLYPNLIRVGNNVRMASGVSFLTHDITHSVLNGLPEEERKGRRFHETIGCISIGDNVFLGAQVRILPDTRIGNRVIVGAGSTVTHDIPDNSVAVGSPARVIGTFDDFLVRRLEGKPYPNGFRAVRQEISEPFAEYLWDEFEKKH